MLNVVSIKASGMEFSRSDRLILIRFIGNLKRGKTISVSYEGQGVYSTFFSLRQPEPPPLPSPSLL